MVHDAGSSPTAGLPGWLQEVALRSPEATFLRWRHETLSYGEADLLVRSLAATLLESASGRTQNGRVAIFAHNCPSAVLVWLAAQAAGLTPVTLNRAHRGQVLGDLLRRTDPVAVFTDATGRHDLLATEAVGSLPVVVLGTTSVRDLGELSVGDQSLARPFSGDRGQSATIMFSSGTTGLSKGVVIPHGMFLAGATRLQQAWQVTDQDVLHCWAPWFHVAAQVNVFALALRSGAAVALYDGFSLSGFWEQIRESGATIFGGFVSVLEMLYAQEPSPRDRDHRLRMGIAGHIPAALRDGFEARFGVPMLDAYGMSEAEPLTIPPLSPRAPLGSCGPANPDFEIQIQDTEGRARDHGTEGQIVFRPLAEHVMMTEYLDDPERTAAAWRNGWFCTGDLGTMDAAGNLTFRDRMSELIRVRGENVSPQEVESVLMTHPDVLEVGVVGVASAQGEHDVKAVVVARPGADLSGLDQWCSGRMAKFMIPRHVEVVPSLPRTPTNKVDRSALRELAETGSHPDAR